MEEKPRRSDERRASDSAKFKKYPDHVPVICKQPDDVTQEKRKKPQKLLVPKHMKLPEFIGVVRERCSWGTPASDVTFSNGNLFYVDPMPSSDLGDVYVRHKSEEDSLLHVIVHPGRVPEVKSDAVVPGKEAILTAQGGVETFHMPSMDQAHPAWQDEDGKDSYNRSKRLLKKYPDRVPVLVKQGRSAGLPDIDKKLLVPKGMRCDELLKILPKNVGIDSPTVNPKYIRLYMGEIALKDESLLSEVYSQYVDDFDGGLHVTIRYEVHGEKPPADKEDDKELLQDEKEQLQNENERMQNEIDALKEQLAVAHEKVKEQFELFQEQIDAAESRADAAENKACVAERRASVASEDILTAELKAVQYEEFHSMEEEKVRQLEEEIKQAAEREQQSHEELAAKNLEIQQLQSQAAEREQQSHEELFAKNLEIEQLQAEVAALREQREQLALHSDSSDVAWTAKLQKVEERAERTEMAKEAALSEAKVLVERVAKLEHEVKLWSQKMAAESAEKSKFEKEASDLAQELEREKTKFEQEKLDLTEQLERARDGYVHINCNRHGFVTDGDEGFEVIQTAV